MSRMFPKHRAPSAYHDYWIMDMEQARSDDAALLLLPRGVEKVKYLYFPGCQLGASDPRYPAATYELLCRAEPATALLLTCCGSPAYWAGEIEMYRNVVADLRHKWEELGRPLVVLACMSCKKLINYVAPEIETTTIYEVLAAAENLSLPHYPGAETFALADPCTAKDNQAVRDAVCKLLDKMNVPYVILHQDMHTLPCCGFGGNIQGADPKVAQKIAAVRIGKDPRPYLAYCSNCRDIFSGAGKDTLHILDLLTGINGKDRKPPHMSFRRDNRRAAKALALHQELLEEYRGMKLRISEEQAELMDKNILNTDYVRQVITHAEHTKNKFIDGQGVNIAHMKLCGVTVWVEYRKLAENEYDLVSTYYNRMEKAEEQAQ